MLETVLITGASGFLGKRIFSELKGKFKIITAGRNLIPDSDQHFFIDFSNNPKTDFPAVDYVIHCASKVHVVPRNEMEASAFFATNVEGTRRLLEGLKLEYLKGFVFISSVSVYGLDEGINIEESHPLLSEEPYGKSKILCEQLLQEYKNKYGFSLCILRLPLICGENPVGNLKIMIEGIRKGRYFRIGAGEARKSMVMVDDLARQAPKFLISSGIYNLTDGYHPSFREIENLISARLGKKIISLPLKAATFLAGIGELINNAVGKRLIPLNRRALGKITKTLTFSDQKARLELGWKPEPVLESLKIE
jgi:GlcNAc-P-P-Und epimerase